MIHNYYLPPLILGALTLQQYPSLSCLFCQTQFEGINRGDGVIIFKRAMEGLKRKRRCQDECKQHLFALQCLKANAAKYDIKLLFCPKYQRDPMPPEFIHPEFNDDRKYYTSAFILGVDRRVLVKNEQQQIMDHQKQVRDSLEKHNQLVFPRPNSKHSHCSVCKDHYRNYYLHIAADEHRQRIAASPYNTHIKTLCSMYEYLWEGAEERADAEADRRASEEEERRQRMVDVTVREDPDEEEEESLLDVQRGEQEEGDQDAEEEEPEEYKAKESKKSHRNHYNNDDTVPLARACKRSAPATGRIYQSEYLRKKQLLNSMITAERLHKEREERRYERERDKVKTERDGLVNREFVRVVEKEGDVFVIMRAYFSAAPPAPTPSTPAPTPNPNNASQTQPEFVWRRTEKTHRREERQKQKEIDLDMEFDRYDWPTEREKERGMPIPATGFGHSAGFGMRAEMAMMGMRPEGIPERIEKENRKYEIHYDEVEFNKEEINEEQYDARYPYYPYPPPPYPPNNYKEPFKTQQTIKPDPSYKHESYKQQTQPFKNESRHNFEPRNEGKAYDPYKNPTHGHPYYNPYPYPMYDHYSRDSEFYSKEKEKTKIGEKPYEYPEVPCHWSYPPPPYYPPHHEQHPPPKATSTTTGNYPGNTNISINFPMYMCPPPHPSYSLPPLPPSLPPSSRYSSPPAPYIGYQYPPYLSNQSRENTYPPHTYPPPPPPPNHAIHQYDIPNTPPPPQGYQPPAHSAPQSHQAYPPYLHHYPPPQSHYQYPPQYPPPSLPQKKPTKF